MVICSGYVLRLLFDRLIFDFVATEFFKYSITPGFEYLDIVETWTFGYLSDRIFQNFLISIL